MATDKYDLHTIDYSVQGWDSIMTADMEKLDDVIHTRIVITAGEAVAQYAAVHLDSDGKYDEALADGTQQPAVGLALESAVLDDEIRVQRAGPITNAGWAWTTIGVPVYLSDADLGFLVDVDPITNSQIMGFVLSATSVFIWPMPGAALKPLPARVVVVKCIADDTALTVADGKAYFTVPIELNGMNLVSVGAHVYTVSSSGLPTFQIHNLTDAQDMLSTALTIDATEKDSKDATTPAVINTVNDDVATGDELRFDCDVAGTGTKGCEIRMGFQTP